MADFIERETAYPLAKKICDAIDSKDFQRLNFGMRILDWIDEIPAADVRPVVRARWEYNPGDNIPYCSECMMPQDSECNYCPNCEADMKEES